MSVSSHSPQQDPSTYLAAERTFLAWIRTGVALMGIGFAVARFGLFLREIEPGLSHGAAHSTGLSVWAGVALVAIGVLVNVSATVRHISLVRQLRTGSWKPGRVSVTAVTLAIVLSAFGVALAIYLSIIR